MKKILALLILILAFSKAFAEENVLPSPNESKQLSIEKVSEKLNFQNLFFIIHGIDASIPKEYIEFEKKYGIGVVKENCVIDPVSYQKAIDNNQMVADYLYDNYGNEWLNDLRSKPLGVE